MDSEKRVAVITGAASGIGLALTEKCLAEGMNVVMADISVATLCDKVEQLTAKFDSDILGVVCDVSRPESLRHLAKQTIEKFNRVDWLFNNAGISGHLAPLWELTNEHIRKVMDINLFGIIHGVQAFLPFMFKQTHRAHIINMASLYGLCSGSQMTAYAMSKHAIVALSESLHFDLQRLSKPVDVSVVCPSFANTQLLSNSSPLHNDVFHDMLSELIARSRPAEDVAEHIVKEVKNNVFYVLPDREVKDYCEQRTQAILEQTPPHQHSLEKILASLSRRAMTIE
ncbi:oxidoreductase dehydrogenase, short chain [Legionella quinlivanii]|uniref:Oxidoreductase dehydrogenase, short chain n=1 Tax=Legionella quinlivanii TaxID=45073 RepID=A0A0W0Y020_9GAMM|nr:SDR family NAD(P)-dependent oxidoreductase [Legionella quinlivanii]KTD49990.1 oxidoreductase dehydrogenase, short chain [Legionella quinlivanii]MCW8450585.1 SDR family NAD(P)-dependent oxidoreductase [Legionella quinlivanii]SEF95446.1 NAD(P)-dependent dehydrogenase, short-chain alcohol dehydrogenase family [Legionella quinlivanii DSM 21216]STY11234.1 oxidoreductase dehydrogenase, short chain [Legionella quinlivanii]